MRAAIVGGGAIGSPLAMQLAHDPVIEELRVIDADRIALSNLPRQPWFNETDIGDFKAKCLVRYAPERLSARVEALTDDNAARLLAGCDIVFDASDNWPARMAIQQWSFQTGAPWIFSSALRAEGMSALLSPKTQCLFCLFGTLQQGPRCFEAGVLGTLTLAVAGQAVTLWELWREHPDDVQYWPQGLFLVDGVQGAVTKIGMKAVQCTHGAR
ncbi:ThiF family adenylyltransferase [Sulfobacillus sp. hq2]|uniref:HesA/MoeB/ThiF family protein n=1 Tax=Sulfobacillus TaxID=28033 RepID=UPI000CD0F802|nr:ThiF family adenylyltransferase [Sulfobacillus sp. hq2]MCY0907821.1 ThiF family adenylyltransferase [Sulfobacillus thermotolerans]POB09463.1 thiamine biosynthesis protein ThiF [Sulfobacillus sp. hq2]